MGSVRRLSGDMPRMFGGYMPAGSALRTRRIYRDLARELGPFVPGSLISREARCAAVLWIELNRAVSDLYEARRLRDLGKGRRPSQRGVDRLATRHRMADQARASALAGLRELAAASRSRNGRLERALERGRLGAALKV